MNVYEKIAEVMKDVQYLSKDGQISYKDTNYRAITEEKVTSSIRPSLIKQGLVILPVKQEHHKEGYLSTVDVTYRIMNIEDPEDFVEVVSSGTGSDNQDKGVGKAMTYAYKYMLLRTFAIPTGEDPDKISSDELTDMFSKDENHISADMATSLRNELARVGKTEAQAKKFCKVKHLEDMTIDQYKHLMDDMENAPDAKETP